MCYGNSESVNEKVEYVQYSSCTGLECYSRSYISYIRAAVQSASDDQAYMIWTCGLCFIFQILFALLADGVASLIWVVTFGCFGTKCKGSQWGEIDYAERSALYCV